MRIVWPLLLIAAAGTAACSSSASRASPTGTVRPAASASPAASTLNLSGEPYTYVRTLPAGSLSAETLRAAGPALTADGSSLSVARADATDVGPWELVSAATDGWRVWWPRAVLDTLAAAGPGATLVSVTSMRWPDSCMGLARTGEVCAQVVTPGYLIIIERAGQRTVYHTSVTGTRRTAG